MIDLTKPPQDDDADLCHDCGLDIEHCECDDFENDFLDDYDDDELEDADCLDCGCGCECEPSGFALNNATIGMILCLFGVLGWHSGGGWLIFIGALLLI